MPERITFTDPLAVLSELPESVLHQLAELGHRALDLSDADNDAARACIGIATVTWRLSKQPTVAVAAEMIRGLHTLLDACREVRAEDPEGGK